MTQQPTPIADADATIDHDRLFKTLLTTFFVDFVALFLPEVNAKLEPDSLEFLSQEIFTDIHSGEKHIVDVLVKVRLAGEETCLLIHVENQASSKAEFALRMFTYFARLHEKYGLPIYPVAVFSFDAPKRAEPNKYVVNVPGLRVLDFRFRAIQLNRLPWRRFMKQANPVAVALMTKMKVAPSDQKRVKLQCLRLLLTLKLDPAKSDLIFLFMETYLRLNTTDEQWYQREVNALSTAEKEQTMELMSSVGREAWRKGLEEGRQAGLQAGLQEGRQEGLQAGVMTVVSRILQRKFGSVPPALQQRVQTLSAANAEALAEELVGNITLADVEAWLDRLP